MEHAKDCAYLKGKPILSYYGMVISCGNNKIEQLTKCSKKCIGYCKKGQKVGGK